MAISQEDRDNIDKQGALDRQEGTEKVESQGEVEHINTLSDAFVAKVQTTIPVADQHANAIKLDVIEFSDTIIAGGWRLGLIVARSVREVSLLTGSVGAKPWEDEGISMASWYRKRAKAVREIVESAETSALSHPEIFELSKMSARGFAREAAEVNPLGKGIITDKTVSKYRNAWNLAAEAGLVDHSTNLFPGQEFKWDERHTPKKWDEFYSGLGEEDDDQTVYEFFKALQKFIDCNLREWIKAENFEGQDFAAQDVYDILRGANHMSIEGMKIMEEELPQSLDLKAVDKSK